ncbi:hypothetical protein PSDI105340_20045 [Pseudoalteromonas distincta]
MRKQCRRNKRRLSQLLQEAHANGERIEAWIGLMKARSQTKVWNRLANRYDVHLDWSNTTFDTESRWLFVQEVIYASSTTKGRFRVYMSINELPIEHKNRFSNLPWDQDSSPMEVV